MKKRKFVPSVFILVVWLIFSNLFVMAQEPTDENAKKAEKIYQEVQTLLAIGRGMESLRHSDDLGVMEECGVQMRKNQSKAEELRIEAESLPWEYILLNEATNGARLGFCVSCKETALEDCDLTEMALKEYAAGLPIDDSTVSGPEITSAEGGDSLQEITTEDNTPAQIPESGGILMVQQKPILGLLEFLYS